VLVWALICPASFIIIRHSAGKAGTGAKARTSPEPIPRAEVGPGRPCSSQTTLVVSTTMYFASILGTVVESNGYGDVLVRPSLS
jgi:hypothetical protein